MPPGTRYFQTCHGRGRARSRTSRTSRQAAGAVPRPDEVLELVDRRPRKSRTDLDHRREVPLTRQSDGAANQQPMRHVGGNEVVLVRTQDRVAEVAVELIVVVQVGRAVRPHVRHGEVTALAAEISAGRLRAPSTRERAGAQQADFAARRVRLEDVLVLSMAPQVVGFEQHAPAEPLVPLDVAGRPPRASRRSGGRNVHERHGRTERLPRRLQTA